MLMIMCEVCGHFNVSSRKTCEHCGSNLSEDPSSWGDMYDVEAHLKKMEKIFTYQKSYILRYCNDWKRDAVKSIIYKIEGLSFVEEGDILLVTSKFNEGLICEASKEHLFKLLKMKLSMCNDMQAIKKKTQKYDNSNI